VRSFYRGFQDLGGSLESDLPSMRRFAFGSKREHATAKMIVLVRLRQQGNSPFMYSQSALLRLSVVQRILHFLSCPELGRAHVKRSSSSFNRLKQVINIPCLSSFRMHHSEATCRLGPEMQSNVLSHILFFSFGINRMKTILHIFHTFLTHFFSFTCS
jgi:hypothetical protein